jgi:hypothetical protein
MWDSHFHGTPSKVIVEEISSENNSDKTFKVGQIYSHPLYVYKLEISKKLKRIKVKVIVIEMLLYL